jgi:hypothetical protein
LSRIQFERIDPREHGDELKALFARNGQTQFEAVYERAYQRRAADGMRSWVGRMEGAAVLHISVTPMLFTDGTRSVQGGIMGDLMVDEPHRDFWNPVGLLRTVVADLKKSGEIRFLLTTTTSDAEPVFKAGGFKPFARIRRYVMPLMWPYLTFARTRARSFGMRATRLGEGPQHPVAVDTFRSGECFRPAPSAGFYDTRLGRGHFSDVNWVQVANGGGRTGAALLSRSTIESEIGIADAFWNDARPDLRDVTLAVSRWARKQGDRRLAMSTLAESRADGALREAGFLARGFRSSLLLQNLGADLPPVDDWFMTGFPLSGW